MNLVGHHQAPFRNSWEGRGEGIRTLCVYFLKKLNKKKGGGVQLILASFFCFIIIQCCYPQMQVLSANRVDMGSFFFFIIIIIIILFFFINFQFHSPRCKCITRLPTFRPTPTWYRQWKTLKRTSTPTVMMTTVASHALRLNTWVHIVKPFFALFFSPRPCVNCLYIGNL